MDIHTYLARCQNRVNKALKKALPSPKKLPRHLHKAMTYSVMNGGKRIRAAFVYAVGEALGANKKILDNIAVAIELIHAFSLVHDDLPALDNDDLRRGKPSCHKAFGEATAIIAGNALLALAIEVLARSQHRSISYHTQLIMIDILMRATGSLGLLGGVELDIEIVNKVISLRKLELIYRLKTGCLISACVLLAVLSANCKDKKIIKYLDMFGRDIGLAFQIHDDIIGIESSTEKLGKTKQVDLTRKKPIYQQIIGITRAKQREKYFHKKAISYLNQINIDSRKLKSLSDYIIERDY